MNQENGFSLIEMLVVTAILGGLAVAASRIFFADMRGAEKTQRLIELRQAGDQAMLTMKKKIRSALEIDSGVLDCSAGASGDAIRVVRRNPRATGFGSTETVDTRFSCVAGNRRLRIYEVNSDTGAVLIDDFLTPSDIAIVDCSAVFTCEKTAGIPARVTIKYSLRNSVGETMDFSSAVSLRNY